MDKLYSITISVSTLAPFCRASPRVAATLFFSTGPAVFFGFGYEKSTALFQRDAFNNI
jgi:hypothetical protein